MAEPGGDVWARWLQGRRDGDDPEARRRTLEALAPVRDRLLDRAAVHAGDVLLDLGTGEGLVAFGAPPRVGASGRVLFSDVSQDLLDHCRALAAGTGVLDRCGFLRASADDLTALGDGSVDVVTTRSVLLFVRDKAQALREVYRVLRPGGRVALFEPINRYFGTTRPAHLFPSAYDGYDVTPVRALAARVAPAEPPTPPEADPMLDFDERDLLALAEGAGFAEVHLELRVDIAPLPPRRWATFARAAPNPLASTLEEAIARHLAPTEAARLVAYLRPLVEAGRGTRRAAAAYLWASKR
jgi:SAM-dependent methyltransferase